VLVLVVDVSTITCAGSPRLMARDLDTAHARSNEITSAIRRQFRRCASASSPDAASASTTISDVWPGRCARRGVPARIVNDQKCDGLQHRRPPFA
jgi:hypothetical protein